jgi:hypothetical protein
MADNPSALADFARTFPRMAGDDAKWASMCQRDVDAERNDPLDMRRREVLMSHLDQLKLAIARVEEGLGK